MTSDNFTGLAGAPEDKKKIPKKFSYLQNKEIMYSHETYLDFYHFLFFLSLLFLMDHLGTIEYNLQTTQSGEKPWSRL